jgi:hypothetical protein
MSTPRNSSARLLCCLAIAGIMFTLAASLPATAGTPLPGAIFTTDAGCSGVDLNIYTTKQSVFLDGGPAHPGAASLPAGSYYVQVTAPDGTVLGSSVPNAPYVVTLDGSGNPVVPCFELYMAVLSASSAFAAQGFDDTPNPGGEYKVWVSTDPSFANDSTKTDNFKVLNGSTTPPPGTSLSGLKFYDANTDGTLNNGESVIDGWLVRLFTLDPNTNLYGFTASELTHDLTSFGGTDGEYLFTNLDPAGTYGVCEVIPSSSPQWVNTTALSITGITIPATSKNFGNVCLGTVGSPVTLGFWSNKNGAFILTGSKTGTALISSYATLLNTTLYLRNANGSRANFASYTAFASWLLSAKATNMANMLSAQLATMELNVATGNVDGATKIYAPGANSANAFGFTTVNALMAEANLALTSCSDPGTASAVGTCSVVASGTLRTYMDALKTALDQGNNGNNFVEPSPTMCSFSYSVGDTCAP